MFLINIFHKRSTNGSKKTLFRPTGRKTNDLLYQSNRMSTHLVINTCVWIGTYRDIMLLFLQYFLLLKNFAFTCRELFERERLNRHYPVTYQALTEKQLVRETIWYCLRINWQNINNINKFFFEFFKFFKFKEFQFSFHISQYHWYYL